MADRTGREGTKVSPLAHFRSKWPQIEPTTLADKVYQIIRNRIMHRELAPGTFIREQEVSRATGVSRTPVREALNRLASQDFLERVPHRGFRVPNRSWESILEIYPMITALDVLAARLAFDHITPADVRRLKDLNQSLGKVVEDGATSARARVELNHAFHQMFAERSGNSKLLEQIGHLKSQVAVIDLWYFSDPRNVETSIREHEQIISALEARDRRATAAGMRRNFERGCETLLKELNQISARA